MANGEEDLKEKNKGRMKPFSEKRYHKWSTTLGKEDSEMLLEKASRWKGYKENRSYLDDEE